MTPKQLKNLEAVFRKKDVVFAYLFGSQATGRANGGSDFDFAVMFSDKIKKSRRFDARLKLISEVSKVLGDDKIEIVSLNDLRKIFFRFVIAKEGKAIFEKDHSARVDFELKAMNEYYDHDSFLNSYNQAFLQRELASAK